jgi:hypothetical protein
MVLLMMLIARPRPPRHRGRTTGRASRWRASEQVGEEGQTAIARLCERCRGLCPDAEKALVVKFIGMGV